MLSNPTVLLFDEFEIKDYTSIDTLKSGKKLFLNRAISEVTPRMKSILKIILVLIISFRSLFGGGWVLKFHENLQSKLPILTFKKQIGFGAVAHSHLLGIPLQTLAGKLTGDHTEA